MKILVVGEYYSTNLGDGVICETVQKLINKYFKYDFDIEEVHIMDISGKNKFIFADDIELGKISFKSKILTIVPKNIRKKIILNHRNASINYLVNFEDYDLVIFAGGQLLMEHFTIQINRIIDECQSKNIPVIYNALGYKESNFRFIQKEISKNILNSSVKRISVRDHLNKINNLTEKNAIFVPDNAIFASEMYGIEKSKSDCIGLGIMYFKEKEQLLDNFWKQIVTELEFREKNWKFFVNGSDSDYQYARNLIKKFELPISKIDKRPQTPEELVHTISQFDKIISFRLHSHIIAYSLQIPSIALAWDKKLDFFFESIHHKELVFNFEKDEVRSVLEALQDLKFDSEDLSTLNRNKKKILSNMEANLSFGKGAENN